MSTQIKVYYGIDPKGHGFFWPKSSQKRKEYFSLKRSAPYTAQSVYQCNPGAVQGQLFLEEDFTFYAPPEYLNEGPISPAVKHFIDSKGGILVQSWDTAQETTQAADYSVCTTGLLVPCSLYHKNEPEEVYGPCDPHFDIYVLNVSKEKMAFGDLFQHVKKLYKLWSPSLVLVEKKVSGISIIQGLRTAEIMVEAMEANDSKRTRATANLGSGSVQGWFRLHRIYFPLYAEWLESAKKELKNFTGLDSGSGVDDFVDSLVHLTSYAIKRGSGSIMLPTGYGDSEGRGGQEFKREIPESLPSNLFTQNSDPFASCCGRCSHYGKALPSFCDVHKQIFPALNSCSYFEGESSLWIIR